MHLQYLTLLAIALSVSGRVVTRLPPGNLGGVAPAVRDVGNTFEVNGNTFAVRSAAQDAACQAQNAACKKAAKASGAGFAEADCQAQASKSPTSGLLLNGFRLLTIDGRGL